jgi:hypothetical protein
MSDITLNWSSVDKANQYRVWKKQTSGDWQLVTTTNKTSHKFTDLTEPLSNWKLAVSALCNGVESATVELALTDPATPPDTSNGGKAPVVNLVRSSTTQPGLGQNYSWTLEWTAVVGATGYNVYLRHNGTWIEYKFGMNSTSLMVGYYKELQAYIYAVTAIQNGVESAKGIWLPAKCPA